MEQIKLWKIESDGIMKISKKPLDYEHRLEKWLIEDISILSSNLAVIGSQVITPHRKKIDILAINTVGELVIIELKRDKTYREVVAQVQNPEQNGHPFRFKTDTCSGAKRTPVPI